ncbi:YicC/YloC family endoribonuclease [Pseudooceanicola sp. LIPI14-2-Ac024]|uniref:YicC/YloC family endoribonuclease n=1 Tax=Pseudooceanicola sp. LIPI14-2-Ac024 TaxID=3344875 RepID=UPI0035D0E8DE
MLRSMTGFATARGTQDDLDWSWDLRAVNARGLDLRLRVPDWLPGLETGLRKRLSEALHRGSVTLNLRVSRSGGAAALALDEAQLDAVFAALVRVEEIAQSRGIALAPSRAADLLVQRGVLEAPREDEDNAPLAKALLADFEAVLTAFLEMRAREGQALLAVLAGQVDRIAELTVAAKATVGPRRAAADAAFRAALVRVGDAVPTVDPDRVAQELAVLAVKSNVTEELDRLDAHVAAARDLLADKGPVGRKLDFLTQEFNREANTLCSKSQNAELTTIGLDLKAVIDQLREQVQNVE